MSTIRVMHFVTGGFSGATQIAIDIIHGQRLYPNIESLLVLRQKTATTSDKLEKLVQNEIKFALITNSSHWASIKQLQQIINQYQPDILVAHGFPEHLIGRWAAKGVVKHILQVEHASHERYTAWRLWQSRYLSKFTQLAIGVSEGVSDVLRQQQLQCPIVTINNGVDTQKFYSNLPITERPKDIIMVARYSKGKNHAIVIEALARLRAQNIIANVTFIGGGSKRHLAKIKKLVANYQLTQQVDFIGHSNDVPRLLREHKIFVLASFYEGLSLSVIEAMAAGCVVIGSQVTGIQELLEDKIDGYLFKNSDSQMLAELIKQILYCPSDYVAVVDKARQKALTQFDISTMCHNYAQLFNDITRQSNNIGFDS